MQTKPEVSSHQEHLAPSEAQFAIFNCLTVLAPLMYGGSSYQKTKEGKDAYLHDLSLLFPWFDYLLNCAKNPPNDETAKQLVYLTSCLLELIVTDDITGVRGGMWFRHNSTPKRSAYARQEYSAFPIGSLKVDTSNILTYPEIAYIFEHPCSDADHIIQSVQEINSASQQIRFGRIFVLEEFPNVESFFDFRLKFVEQQKGKDDDIEVFNVFLRIRLTDNVGCIVGINILGNFLSFTFQSRSHFGITQPLSPVAKSESWRAALSTGSPAYSWKKSPLSAEDRIGSYQETFQYCISGIFDDDIKRQIETLIEATKTQSKLPPVKLLLWLASNLATMETWQRGLLYKKLIRVVKYDVADDSEKQSYLSAIIHRHQEHFQELFTDPELIERPEVILTRSGISANGVAMMAANIMLEAQGLKGRINMYKVEGWYYENKPPNEWHSMTPQRANILLVNMEPNGPVLSMSADEYISNRDMAIAEFLKNVWQNPQSKFVMIVDKTSDLLNHDYFPDGIIPDNLTVFETASLTKHQRGGKSYFFGSLASWHNPLSQEQMRELVVASTGELTPDSVFALSRISKREITQQIQHNRQLSDEFSRVLDLVQQKIPKDQRWQWQTFKYFGYLLPPEKMVKDHFAGKKNYQNTISGEDVGSAINSFFMNESEVTLKFDKGDSFGLNTTRITAFNVGFEVSYQEIYIFRIGFGRKTSVEDMRQFAEHILSKLVRTYHATQ